ncbi:DUF3822 family protein [Winogradskyella maritima]|uniref:DUF3822 family protein n=1 Tax=Winogradskyella maritima TaxID=1517766 RepID=A0ABV8ALU7_9FLAO|nr:DUF3822 family protein [Winogradskyella maritima]
MSHNTIKDLSIQVDLNGLSFCILNRTEKQIEYLNTIAFETKLNPSEALDQLKAELSTNTVFSDDFESVVIIHQNELSSLVPTSLYDEALNADYLKFNTKILQTDFISHDTLKTTESVNVYVPYVNINNYIFDTFGSFTYKHASTAFIDSVLALDTTKNTLYVNVSTNALAVVAVKDKRLELYNRFEYHSKEDFIYYLLFVVEQLGWNPEILDLKLSGQIYKDDDNYSICYKYIRNVSFTDKNLKYSLNKKLNGNPNANHIILNSF